ncbi:hypothetical protein MTR67_027429 [Solanum verrucosum]|uniref:RNA-binding protein n=1 Tax=Solanum verrucosum TaxID=315347 RepID=A0AAF0TVP5_SOLVR|nr:hypothetical protein MTR67_027429 [Solanum verrucosum]
MAHQQGSSRHKRVRQSDPLSPFLFLLAMEGLNSIVKTTNMNGWLRGFNVAKEGRDNLEVIYLQYADDTLIFCDADEEQIKILRVILVLFEGMSGLHINWGKSFLYPINEVTTMQSLNAILGGEIGSLPAMYLGMPLGANSKSNEIWNNVVEKSIIISRSYKIRKKFLWQGNKDRKSYHLVKWESLIIDKKFGGLGIKNLDTHSNNEMAMENYGQKRDGDSTSKGNSMIGKYQEWQISSTRLSNSVSGLGTDEDELWWKGDEKGTYKVSKAYRKMNHNQQPSSWPWKNIWKTKIPYKVACFVWLLTKEAVLTQENLMERGIILSPSNAWITTDEMIPGTINSFFCDIVTKKTLNISLVDAPSGPEYPGYYGRDAERGMPRVGRDADPIEASYERYLRSGQISSHVASESARSMHSGISGHPIDDPRVMGIGGSDPLAFKNRNVGMVGGRPEATLPPDASSTLFVEGLPADCTRREVSHLFRPFLGYKEVRLVPKGSRHAGGDPLILCFVDFVSPLHAATAMDALQGYKFDEHERDSVSLKLQFSRNPGARSGLAQVRRYIILSDVMPALQFRVRCVSLIGRFRLETFKVDGNNPWCTVELLNIIHEDLAMIGDRHWHGKNCDPTNVVQGTVAVTYTYLQRAHSGN